MIVKLPTEGDDCPHTHTDIKEKANWDVRGRIDHHVCTACGKVVAWERVR